MNDRQLEELARWLGIADVTSRVPDNAHLRFELGSLPQQQAALFTALAALALVGLAFWLYRREGNAALWKKLGLATLRALTIGLAFLVLFEPRLAIDIERVDTASTIVVWDDSLSMSLPDRYLDEARRSAVAEAAGLAGVTSGGVTTLSRADIAFRIVERARLLPRLGERNKVKLYVFGEDARALPSDKVTPADVKPKGAATDLARAVRRALEEQGGRTVAAVVAITDGRANKGEGPKAVASELRDRGIPFYAIGIGDPTPPKNIELSELIANERAYKNDPLVIEARVRARGYEGEKLDVELTIAPAENPQRTERLGTQTVELKSDGVAEKVTFTHTPKEVGKYVITARVPAREEELVKDDNARSAPVAVIDDETRVLIVSGGPTYEYRFLKNMLIRDKTIQLSTFLQSADESFPQEGTKKIEAIPRTKEQLTGYDVICLMDPNPSGFDKDLAEALRYFVEKHGGGLLFVAGEKYTPGFCSDEAMKDVMRDLLPVVLEPGDIPRGPFAEPWPFKLTEEAEESAITRLDQSLARSKAIWAKLPPAYWHYPVLREKPGAAVLVRHGDQRGGTREPPLVVTHFFGPGRTMFAATDETWRWRAVAPKAYDRFWIQALRFLVEGRLLGGTRRVELLVDKNDYSLGEPVRIRAKCKDSKLELLKLPELVAHVRHQDGETENVTLKLTEGRVGHYEATYLPSLRGSYELTLRLPDLGSEEKPATLPFTVRLPDLEFANPRLDEELLQEIAQATGGALVALRAPPPVPAPAGAPAPPEPVTLQNLPDRIPDRTETLVVAGQPIPLWDNRTTLIAACVLLGLEWFLRKRCRMV